MKLFKWFKVGGEDREFMYLYESPTKQEVLDFLGEFKQRHNKGDLYRITSYNKRFYLWDARF